MKKLVTGLILFCGLCVSWNVAKAEPPNYSWDSELKADIGRDGRSWTKGYFGTDLIFEGSTSDGSETTFTITNPTRDNNLITVPDATGTVKLHNFVNIYFGSSATKTLNTNESQASVIRGYGTTAACTITAAPSIGQMYILINSNTATATITLKISGGTGTVLSTGSVTVCYANGTNTDFSRVDN